jgi:GNAT superfamily N-acetyltransferase
MNDPIRRFHVESDADFDRAFPVMVQLRPHLTPDSIRERVRRQAAQGYRLAALEAGGRIRSLGGYRLCDFLWSGRTMYVDDLVTDEASRSHRYGEQLFHWLRELAVAGGCTELHLDSGLQRARAHRFYFRQGMHVDDFHFVLRLAPAAATGGPE